MASPDEWGQREKAFPLVFLSEEKKENIKENSIFFFYFKNATEFYPKSFSVSECTRVCFLCLAVRDLAREPREKKRGEKKKKSSSKPRAFLAPPPRRMFFFPLNHLRHTLFYFIHPDPPPPGSFFLLPFPARLPAALLRQV